MNKKTNFPDLEILPPHNHFKHFLDWLVNKPHWIIKDYIRKNFLDKNIELEVLKMNLEIKEIELTLLKNEINILKKSKQKV
jgi:hypothetical protein